MLFSIEIAYKGKIKLDIYFIVAGVITRKTMYSMMTYVKIKWFNKGMNFSMPINFFFLQKTKSRKIK